MTFLLDTLAATIGQTEVHIFPSSLYRDAAIAALLGIIAGLIICRILITILGKQEFDELFSPPWKPLRRTGSPSFFRASSVLAAAVFLSVLILTGWLLQQGYPDQLPSLAPALHLLGQLWLGLVVLLVAFALARFIAAAILTIFANQTVRDQLELMFPNESTSSEEEPTGKPASAESIADTVARLVGMVVYLLVFLPVLMIAAELWNWNVVGSVAGEIWRWMLPFAGLAALVTIGWFIITAAALAVCPPEFRKPVMIFTTILAVILLTIGYNLTFAVLALGALLALGWFFRKEIPDLTSGIYLKFQRNIELKTETESVQLQQIGPLVSQIECSSGKGHVRNRQLLQAFLNGTPLRESAIVFRNRDENLT